MKRINLYRKTEKGKKNRKKSQQKYRKTEKGRINHNNSSIEYHKTEKGKENKDYRDYDEIIFFHIYFFIVRGEKVSPLIF